MLNEAGTGIWALPSELLTLLQTRLERCTDVHLMCILEQLKLAKKTQIGFFSVSVCAVLQWGLQCFSLTPARPCQMHQSKIDQNEFIDRCFARVFHGLAFAKRLTFAITIETIALLFPGNRCTFYSIVKILAFLQRGVFCHLVKHSGVSSVVTRPNLTISHKSWGFLSLFCFGYMVFCRCCDPAVNNDNG